MAIKGLVRLHPNSVLLYKYEYKGCYISKSLYPKGWYVHAAYKALDLSRGIKANTLMALCKKIDKDLKKK